MNIKPTESSFHDILHECSFAKNASEAIRDWTRHMSFYPNSVWKSEFPI